MILNEKQIFNKLKDLLNLSYSPYSNFQVATIILDKKGNYYEGINVENAAYGEAICAERSAIVGAVSRGMKMGDLKKVYLLAKSKKSPKNNLFVSPCGACRQVINEASNSKAEVYMFNLKGKVKKTSISKILPLSFSGKDL